jgi:plastocyanin
LFPVPLLFPVLLLIGCGGSDGPTGTSNTPTDPGGTPAASATIQVMNDFYSPSTVLISPGGKVTWNWVGEGHSVTPDGSPTFSPGAPISNPPRTLEVVFASAGTYSFHCTAHGVPGVYGGGTMTGAVFVR